MLYTVSFFGAPVSVIGPDDVDAVAGALQALGGLRDVIALYRDTRPEMADVVLRAAPPASDPNPWPDAAAIRTIVADWWKGHTAEITVVRA